MRSICPHIKPRGGISQILSFSYKDTPYFTLHCTAHCTLNAEHYTLLCNAHLTLLTAYRIALCQCNSQLHCNILHSEQPIELYRVNSISAVFVQGTASLLLSILSDMLNGPSIASSARVNFCSFRVNFPGVCISR